MCLDMNSRHRQPVVQAYGLNADDVIPENERMAARTTRATMIPSSSHGRTARRMLARAGGVLALLAWLAGCATPLVQSRGQHPMPEALAAALNGVLIADGLIRIETRVPLAGRLGRLPLDVLARIPPLPGETDSPSTSIPRPPGSPAAAARWPF